MEAFFRWLHQVDWLGLCIELGLGLFILISLVRCALN